MIIDIENLGNSLRISHYNSKGKPEISTYDVHRPWKWVTCNNGDKNADPEYTSWNNKPVKHVKSNSLDRYSLIEFIENLPQEEKDKIFAYNLPEVFFFDIEVEITEGFPHAEQANNQITTISIITPSKYVIVFGTRDLANSEQLKIQESLNNYFKNHNVQYKFNYTKFNSEYDMLTTFLDKVVSKAPMLTGWNVIKFDWQYIYNRCKKIGVDITLSSPVRNMKHDTLPYHVGFIDYLELYRDWDRSISIKEDFKLETASMAVNKIGKIKYDGNLQDLYESDYTNYVYYNCVDSCLVDLIHMKLKTAEIPLTISNICKVPFYKASSPVSITESILCREYLSRKMVMPNDQSNAGNKSQQYEGAYVKDPVVGKHWSVVCYDFASLYPSIMRQLNISPESYIKNIKESEINESRNDKSIIVSSSGAIFDKKPSVLKHLLDDMYGQRKSYKKTYLEAEDKAEQLKIKIKKIKTGQV